MNKGFLKNFYYYGLSAIGVDRFRLQKIKRENKIAVLNLHGVAPTDNPYWSPIHPRMFDELLGFLQKKFTVCTFAELESIERSNKPLAILSFDDGYYNFIEYALPLLVKHGMRANMNIIPQCAESGKPIWNVRLYDFLNSASRALINEIKLPGFTGSLADDNRAAKIEYGLHISSFLKKRPRREREKFWEMIEPFLAKSNFRQTRMMTTEEIRSIAGAVEIGAHSFAHESMGFEDFNYFSRDFLECATYFREKLEQSLTIYAFPNGSYRAEQIDFLRQKGVEHVLLVDENFAEAGSEIYPRLTIYGDTAAQVKMKSLGF